MTARPDRGRGKRRHGSHKGQSSGGRSQRRPSSPADPFADPLVGIRPVQEALRAGRRELLGLWLRSGATPRPALQEILETAKGRGVRLEELSASDFEARVGPGRHHQGIALQAGPLPVLSLQEMPDVFANAETLIALDGVEDPQNLGSIARVALGAGVSGLILPRRRSAPLSSATGRASAGAIEHLPIAIVPNLREAIRRLQRRGFRAIGAHPAGDASLYEEPLGAPLGQRILVLGGEEKGLRPLLESALDHRIRIPINDQIQSLNVATAAAVILFEWKRRRDFPAGTKAE